jgi:hypothetical protein
MSVVSEIELEKHIKTITNNRQFEAGLFLSGGTPFTSASDHNSLTTKEVPASAGGYTRLSYTYTESDVSVLVSKATTTSKYFEFIHNGNSIPMRFDTFVVFERIAAQPLDIVNIVSIHSLGGVQELTSGGNIARFNLQVNIKTQ